MNYEFVLWIYCRNDNVLGYKNDLQNKNSLEHVGLCRSTYVHIDYSYTLLFAYSFFKFRTSLESHPTWNYSKVESDFYCNLESLSHCSKKYWWIRSSFFDNMTKYFLQLLIANFMIFCYMNILEGTTWNHLSLCL